MGPAWVDRYRDDPDVYPMNWARFDGKMSERLYREEHGLEAKKTIGKEIENRG